LSVPTVHAVGTEVEGVGDITVAWPDHQLNDIGVLLVETANQAVSAPAGWTAISNQGTGTAGTAAATRITALWKRAASAAEASVVVADTGARQIGVIMVLRGCIESGDPYDVVAGDTAFSSSSVIFPGVTTTVDETLVLNILSNPQVVDALTVQGNPTNASLSNIATRLNTQAPGEGGGVPTLNALPIGLSTFGSGGAFGDVGEGPGMDTTGPRCQVVLFVPNTADIGAQIDIADEHDILLVLNVAGNKGAWSTTIGGTVTLDMGKYEANVRRFGPDNTNFADRAKFADAVRRKRIVFYSVDEPNLTNENNSRVPDISPTQVNQMCLIHKAVWADYSPIVIIRCAANTLRDGWNGLSRPSSGYTGADYCWASCTNTHGKGGTNQWGTPIDPRDLWEEQRTIATTLNLGIVGSLNLWAGGIGNDFLGVSARWDTGNNDGPLGYVLGDRESNPGQVVTTLLDSYKSLMCPPDWIKKFADLAAADADMPFILFWQHATATNPSSDYLTFYQRSDVQDALDYAITAGLSRTTFNGWRTPK
jgi:hypothetical protein